MNYDTPGLSPCTEVFLHDEAFDPLPVGIIIGQLCFTSDPMTGEVTIGTLDGSVDVRMDVEDFAAVAHLLLTNA